MTGHAEQTLQTPAEVARAFRVDPKTVGRWAAPAEGGCRGTLKSSRVRRQPVPERTCSASFAIVATKSGVGGSGWPWLGSGKAYGIHKAHSSTVGSIYSKIGYRPNGWAIYTG